MAEPIRGVPFTSARRDLFDSLGSEFLQHYRKGRTIIAVDGLDGSGTELFADGCAVRLARTGHGVFRASVADFHRPRLERDLRGAHSPEGFYQQAFDYDLLRRVLLEPFRLGGSTGFVTAAFDAERDIPIEMQWSTGPMDATLIIDGLFLNRPELRGLWNFSLWLESAGGVQAPVIRGAGSPYRAGAELLYYAIQSPRIRANAIVDNTDPQLPERIFADSC